MNINRIITETTNKYIKCIIKESINDANERLKEAAKLHEKFNCEGLPIYYSYEYVPTYTTNTTSLDKRIQHKIWIFKHEASCSKVDEAEYRVVTYDDVLNEEEHLFKMFFEDDCKELTFVTVPCSSKENHARRWKAFSNDMCNRLGMKNGYSHITITKDAVAPSHYSGKKTIADYNIDEAWFKGRTVVIFDDVVTEGFHISELKNRLEKCGADVIMAITLAKTLKKQEKVPLVH